MTYAISDIHGCYDKYMKIFEKIGFSDSDTLYVLGDVIDRGEDGIAVLQDMMKRKNVRPIIGNHEFFALKLMKNIALSPAAAKAIRNTNDYKYWMQSGGKPTAKAFCSLDNEAQRAIVHYIESFSVTDMLTVGGKKFHLSHTIPDYDEYNPFGENSDLDFIYGEPDYNKQYSNGIFFITGHTPTELIGSSCKGKIYQMLGHIAIDCGAVFGNPLGCFCLDTMKDIYIK